MDWQDRLNGLYFNDDNIFDKNIDAIPEVNGEVVILDGKYFLHFEWHFLPLELVTQTHAIWALEQSWAKARVHTARST